MEFQPGAISLSQIAGGILSSGTVPFQRFQRFFDQVENPGIVTLTAAMVQINYMATTGAQVGDYILAWSRLAGTKAGIAGRVLHTIEWRTGPGVVDWLIVGPTVSSYGSNVPANQPWAEVFFALGIITTGGNMALRTQGSSIGSNFVIPGVNASLSAWIIPGS